MEVVTVPGSTTASRFQAKHLVMISSFIFLEPTTTRQSLRCAGDRRVPVDRDGSPTSQRSKPVAWTRACLRNLPQKEKTYILVDK
jgi:hypothetical protein